MSEKNKNLSNRRNRAGTAAPESNERTAAEPGPAERTNEDERAQVAAIESSAAANGAGAESRAESPQTAAGTPERDAGTKSAGARGNRSGDVESLFSELLDSWHKYQADETPLAVFLIAFRRFYAAAVVRKPRRFRESLGPFGTFFERIADVEADEDAPGAWRAFENGVAAVERYDRRRRAELTPPSRTIDELLALGVSRPQVAKIYGFYTPNGDPDVAAVERRDEWRAPIEDDEPNEDEDAREIARLALSALESGDERIQADAETVEALRALAEVPEVPEKPAEAPETSADAERERIEREILDGVPERQIAARHGVTVESIRAAAAALNVTPTRSAAQLPPRLALAIESRRAELDAGRTYREIAAEVSSGERVVTPEEVAAILGPQRSNGGV